MPDGETATPTCELVQFAYSPYNEKARWALDMKGVPHTRTSLLPGPHMPRVRKLTGQTATPVIKWDDDLIYGSARILEDLERRHPEPALYPADPGLRDRALEIQARFDDDLIPRIRRAVLNDLIDEPAYLCRLFGGHASAPMRLFYRSTLPLAKGLIRRGNGITGPESVEDGVRAAQEAFDFVAEASAATGYLVGSTFTIADLTAAAGLAAAANPEHPDMKRPEPMPDNVRDWLGKWDQHPGAEWVRDIYRRHRP